jgi:hypothetical protein
MIVAIIFPPKAGLVIKRCLVSSSISREVQSAVNPVCILADTLGAKSLPIEVAPTSTTSGFSSLITLVSAFVYGSVTKFSRIISSTTITFSAP